MYFVLLVFAIEKLQAVAVIIYTDYQLVDLLTYR